MFDELPISATSTASALRYADMQQDTSLLLKSIHSAHSLAERATKIHLLDLDRGPFTRSLLNTHH